MYSQHTLYLIATSMLSGIGPVLAKQLISYLGSVEQIFKESAKNLAKIPKIGEHLAREIKNNEVLALAEKELAFIIKNNIQITSYTDSSYPQRLKNCDDSPLLLFYKGNANFNEQKIISIVGTRNATEYGKKCCEELMLSIKEYSPIIVSGLAFGIDVCAHKEALKNGLCTIAIIGTPLTNITPASNIKTAKEIVQHGAVMSECHTQTVYDNALYVKRNRIIAGMADATIIVESKTKGGSLITAEFAHQYNRDVCAFPGSIHNKYSEGCHMLIKQNKASLIENGEDVARLLNWDLELNKKSKKHIQKQLFVELTEEEQKIYNHLFQVKEQSIDQISNESFVSISKTASILLSLEFKGLIKQMPGKRFAIQ